MAGQVHDLSEKDPRYTDHVESASASSGDKIDGETGHTQNGRDWTPEEERKIV